MTDPYPPPPAGDAASSPCLAHVIKSWRLPEMSVPDSLPRAGDAAGDVVAEDVAAGNNKADGDDEEAPPSASSSWRRSPQMSSSKRRRLRHQRTSYNLQLDGQQVERFQRGRKKREAKKAMPTWKRLGINPPPPPVNVPRSSTSPGAPLVPTRPLAPPQQSQSVPPWRRRQPDIDVAGPRLVSYEQGGTVLDQKIPRLIETYPLSMH